MNLRQLGDGVRRLRLPVLGIRRQELEREPELELKHPDLRGPLEALPGRNPARLLVWPKEEVQVPRDLEGLSRQVKERIENQFRSRLTELEREPELELKHPDLRGRLEALPGRNPARLLVWPREEEQVPRDLEGLSPGKGTNRKSERREEYNVTMETSTW